MTAYGTTDVPGTARLCRLLGQGRTTYAQCEFFADPLRTSGVRRHSRKDYLLRE
jgi:hypothetical protein